MNIFNHLATDRDAFMFLAGMALFGALSIIASAVWDLLVHIHDARKRRTRYPFDGNKGGRL